MKTEMCILICILIISTQCAVIADKMSAVPGYVNFTGGIYSGYLATSNKNRFLHYVFIEGAGTPNNNLPLTVWLNGGPGCSSLLGFLQEIGPFYLEDGKNYTQGESLIKNPYSWHSISNLLFIESPAGVGYSYNDDPKFEYNDDTTAKDNFDAIMYFFSKFGEYGGNDFWLAGESYAGKYIPDLAFLIDQYNVRNEGLKINLKGLLVGNGVMNFQEGQLAKSTVDYMIDHEFVDPELLYYYRSSCQVDPSSAGCRYFQTRFEEGIDELNPYNVYGYCYYKDDGTKRQFLSESSIIRQLARSPEKPPKANGAPCAYFTGLYNYFNSAENAKAFNARTTGWNGPCADNITGGYSISLRGSMDQYRYLLGRKNIKITLYNGNVDAVVPYTDTLKNIEKLNLAKSTSYLPFFSDGQHAGWIQTFPGLTLTVVKGASHMVPQSKRKVAFDLFRKTIMA